IRRPPRSTLFPYTTLFRRIPPISFSNPPPIPNGALADPYRPRKSSEPSPISIIVSAMAVPQSSASRCWMNRAAPCPSWNPARALWCASACAPPPMSPCPSSASCCAISSAWISPAPIRRAKATNWRLCSLATSPRWISTWICPNSIRHPSLSLRRLPMAPSWVTRCAIGSITRSPCKWAAPKPRSMATCTCPAAWKSTRASAPNGTWSKTWRITLAEFTGERLIPGEVDIDLLNEHMARYHFAVRLARGKRVLDAGCGAGYGSAELADVAESVTAIDIAPEAVEYARAHYALPNLAFEQASCIELPFVDGAFDLVVAFEVIEHLENWRGFLLEVRRVLAPSGQLIVSTPNRLYYTESRGPHGANPFHGHEFDFDEFTRELREVFPYVSMFLENHIQGVTFQPHEAGHTVETRVDAAEPVPDESHFFIAVCAHRPQIGNPTFLYVPRVANVLRERERHIAKLEGELATKDEWLDKAQADLAEFDREHQKLLEMFREQKEELEQSNRWAEELNAALGARGAPHGQPGADGSGTARTLGMGAPAGGREAPTGRPAQHGARLAMGQAGAQGRPRPRALTWPF